MAWLIFGIGELGWRLEKLLTWSEIKYLSGNFSSGGARQQMNLWPILPHEVQYTSNLSYFKKIQRSSPSSLQKENPGFRGLLTSISIRSLRKLLKVFLSLLESSTWIIFPSPLPIDIAILVVMLINGRPWTWIQNEAEWRESSLKVALGCHYWRMIRKPLTFQVTCFRILAECFGLDSLNENLLGPNIAKEKGTANSQALVRVANTDWLLWVFWEMTWPTSGRHSSEGVIAVKDSIWDEWSSQKRASVWAMRLSIFIGKGEEKKKKENKREREITRKGWKPAG